jgi:hypothetical protein
VRANGPVNVNVKVKVRPERPNGYTLWEGPSAEDGAPLACVATGFVHASDNPKTGPMLQVCLFRSDVPPHVAVTTGQDQSVCNGCELRQFTVKNLAEDKGLRPGHKPPMCYVTTSNGLRAKYDAYTRGKYPRVRGNQIRRLVRGRKVRLGEYGNFSNADVGLVRDIAEACDGWTLYEHNWRAAHAQPLRPYAMASVSSLAGKAEANKLGWRTYRVKRPWEPVLDDEVVCPASEEAGYKTTCDRCLLCQGTSKKAKNIVVNDHGPTSQGLNDKRTAARWGLPTVS